jgi:hypothetical protein
MTSLAWKSALKATIFVAIMVTVARTAYVWAEESSRLAKSDSGDNAPEAPKLDDSLRDLLKPYADAFGYDLDTPFLGLRPVADTRDHVLPFDRVKEITKVEFSDKSFFLLSKENRVLVFQRGHIGDAIDVSLDSGRTNDHYRKKAVELAARFVAEDVREIWSLRSSAKNSRYVCKEDGVFTFAAAKMVPSSKLGAIATAIPFFQVDYDWKSGRVVYYQNSTTPALITECVKTTKKDALERAKDKWTGNKGPEKVEINGPLMSYRMNAVIKEIEPCLVWEIFLGTEQNPRRCAVQLRCDNLDVEFFNDMLTTF